MYFSEAVVGDKVWDYVYGEGVITDIADNDIAVVDANETAKRFYTLDGRYGKDDANQRLFYYDNRPIVITQDDLELDDSIEYNMCQSGEISQLCSDGKINKVNINIDIAGQTRKVRRETPEDEKTLEERVSILEEILYK